MIDRIRCRLHRGGSRIAALAALSLAAMPALFAQAAPAPPAPPAVMKLQLAGTYLGVGVADILTQERAKELNLREPLGVEITWVEEDSPAERAGLRKNDVVLDYNGTRVEGIEQFIRLVRETPAGRVVKLTVSRGGTTQTLNATIEARKGKKVFRGAFPGVEPPNFNVWIPDVPRAFTSWRSSMLGIEAESLDGQLAQYFGVKEGVLVRSVVKDTPAEKAGLKAGDVILKMDGNDVTTPRELSTSLRNQRGKQSVPFTIMRERRESTVTVTLEQERGRVTTPSRRATTQRDEF